MKDTRKTLAHHVESAVNQYFDDMEEVRFDGLYDKVIHQVEKPLLKVVMERSGENQTVAAKILGLNRNTLRKKLKNHGMLD